jgi:prepilin-type N-terminal cleavage/methylation domain-containing protein
MGLFSSLLKSALRGTSLASIEPMVERTDGAARTTRTSRRRRRSASTAGFSLIELMVVVTIIAIFAALAIPAIMRSNDDRKAFEEASLTAQLLQEARGRALATGAAQIVVMQTGGSALRGQFLLYQASYNQVASASCLTSGQWAVAAAFNLTPPAPPPAGPGVTLIDAVNLQYSPQSTLQSQFYLTDNTGTTTMVGTGISALCFTPGGRVYYAPDGNTMTAGQATTLSQPFEIRIRRYPGGTAEGITRSVTIDGSDTARVRSF